MESRQTELEGRIVALEYALQVLTDCLSDRKLVDSAKIARLLNHAADDPEVGRSNPCVPRALADLAKRL